MKLPSCIHVLCPSCGETTGYYPDTSTLEQADVKTKRGWRRVARVYYRCIGCGRKQLYVQEGQVGVTARFKAVT